MKKNIFLLICISISSTLFASDESLNGSWGVIVGDSAYEALRVDVDEIIIIDKLFRSGEYEIGNGFIHIEDFDGEEVMIQYHFLEEDKLLFIITNLEKITESITLIFQRLE
ncbi:hypothetical protein [Spirochaeta isovalerica]|uniref:Uncharacterized protein n=1 Tax=Spirochaeta isovalerica TaxID=150 RepID=A0A841RET9_9SPIO|nr:hypothetical protein [Spirochaeta isovalerica]MBB6481520.1 hypothetical protein [Spirochaeta isovalerica]